MRALWDIQQATVAYWLLLGQLCLFGFLLVCLLLIPHFLLEHNQGGVSNYGLYAKTVVPYTLGFGLCGMFTLYASRQASQGPVRHLKLAQPLALLGGLYILAMASTYGYKANPVIGHVHTYLSTALVIAQLALGIWFAVRLVPDAVNRVLLAAQCLGFTLGVLNYLGFIHVLFVIELFTSLAFGALLVRTAIKLQM